jgi:subtilisin family serine protease
VEGIRWAIKQGADIISMSFAGRRSSSDLYFAIQQALWLGKFVICAAGNDGFLYQNGIGYPGRYGGVITVAAHDRNGNPAGFSSRGGEVDVVGPGEDIWSTFRHNGWSGYAKLSGTSMAAPFVAGLAALIVSKHKFNTNKNGTPLTNNEDLKEHLLRLSTHPGHHDAATGYGVLRPLRYFEGGQ